MQRVPGSCYFGVTARASAMMAGDAAPGRSSPPGRAWSPRGWPRARTGRGRALLRRALDEGVHALDLPAAERSRSGRAGAARSPLCGWPVRSTRPATSRTTSRRPSAAPSRSTTSAAGAGGRCATRAWTSTCGGTGRSTSTRPTSPRPPSTRWSTTCSTAGTAGCCRSPLVPRGRRFSPPPSPRRACLFAIYDPDGLVDDCVVAYVAELARHADVFVCADGSLAVRPAGPAGRLRRGRLGAPPRRARLRLVEPDGARAGRLVRAGVVRRGAAGQRLVLAAPPARRGVRPDGRAALRLLGAAADRPPLRARGRHSPRRCRSRR